ncbi:DsbA family protein [Frankia nepalensis]|uniref:DsbA family protein n=1 Tax=Frankia nepalensis TaxID=1836974 RepID=UPI00288BF296|nr:DsbA family protein [Frankia nepalensis]
MGPAPVPNDLPLTPPVEPVEPAGPVEPSGSPSPTDAPAPSGAARLGERPSRGDPAAPVVLVEYGDFQCPYCAQAAPALHELVEVSGGLVRHEFRHFPVFQIHPYALTAALAAEAAHAHEMFWPMHDLLFAQQDRLKDVDLRMRAERLGLDPDLVVGDPAQPYGDAVEADYERGVAEGVRGTPTIFINGQPFRGRPELPALRRAVVVAAAAADPSVRRLG